jgi:hypothetical protein
MATTPEPENDIQPEYDLSQLKGGVRGKYFARYQANPPRVVRLDPDVAAAFPTDAAVNEALRKLAEVTRLQHAENAVPNHLAP